MKEEALKKIFINYRYTDDDAEVIKDACQYILPHVEEFSERLHEFVLGFDHARAFLKTEEEVTYHKKKIEYWFMNLFNSVRKREYYEYLSLINELHKRIGLPSNYINSTFTFIRRFIRTKLLEAGKISYMDSVEKVLDLNLELLSSQYVGEDFEEMLEMIRTLRESIDKDYIVPYVQKIVSAEDFKTESYECLCRIEHPELGTISPAQFMDISRQINVYSDITRVMFKKSFEAFSGTGHTFSINLSYSDICNEETRSFIRNIITAYNPEDKLILEIIETEELFDNDMLYSFCKEVKELGVQIAIDDFGAGFSNFNNINRISPDLIKIDGSLIKDIDYNTINLAAVESIVAMSKKLGIKTVAEFIHSEDVQEVCRTAGVDKLQGFHIAKPVTLKEALG